MLDIGYLKKDGRRKVPGFRFQGTVISTRQEEKSHVISFKVGRRKKESCRLHVACFKFQV
jgi:hypothetical protein